jgi:hypothetical protein
MPCWPDLWEAISVWLAGPRLTLLLIVVVIVLMLWVPVIRWRWLKIVLRVVGGSAALFILAVAGGGSLFGSGAPKPQYKVTNSPNGLHQATLMYQAGFLGRDLATVKVTRRGSCKHFTAYVYEGPSTVTRTMVTWTDDSHLQIRYYFDHDRYQRCKTQVADVSITCVPLAEGAK